MYLYISHFYLKINSTIWIAFNDERDLLYIVGECSEFWCRKLQCNLVFNTMGADEETAPTDQSREIPFSYASSIVNLFGMNAMCIASSTKLGMTKSQTGRCYEWMRMSDIYSLLVLTVCVFVVFNLLFFPRLGLIISHCLEDINRDYGCH